MRPLKNNEDLWSWNVWAVFSPFVTINLKSTWSLWTLVVADLLYFCRKFSLSSRNLEHWENIHKQTETPASVYLCAYVKWRIWEIMTSSPQIMPCLKQQRQTIWYVLCQKLQRPNVKMSTNLNYYPSPSLVECLEYVILTETLRAPGSIIQTLRNCIEWGDNVIL